MQILIFLCFLFFFGCGSIKKSDIEKDYFDKYCIYDTCPPYYEPEKIIGNNLQWVLSNSSTPTSNVNITISNKELTLYEYQSHLYKILRDDLKRDGQTIVKELLWEKQNYTIAVWLYKKEETWIVISELRWKDIVEW